MAPSDGEADGRTRCFAAGTKLLTRRGWLAVEDIAAGDEVAARHELDPSGEVEWKAVEATFRRTGHILHLHFPDGELIRTTPEHPFFIEGQGWTPAGALKEGDKIATLVGDSVPVAEVYDTGAWEVVYNLRVADFHTYFVGDEDWSFAAWAHNSYNEALQALADSDEMVSRGVTLQELKSSPKIRALIQPNQRGKVHNMSARDFADELRDALAWDGFMKIWDKISVETAETVKIALWRPSPTPINPSANNPYATNTPNYAVFQRRVIQNTRNLALYMRIKALIAAGVAGAERLISHLPGGDHASRFRGLAYHLKRAEYYQGRGELAEIEASLGGGDIDLKLTNGSFIDAKAWTQDWWEGKSPNGLQDVTAQKEVVRKLKEQITNYLDSAQASATLKLEFASYVPDLVAQMVTSLNVNPLYAGRVSAEVVQ